MSEIIVIAAVSDNNVIGNNGSIPWKIDEDLKRFKELTKNHVVVMGRKTFDSLPEKPLKDRTNIVLTKSKGFNHEGVIAVNSMEDALVCKDSPKIFIIGGESVYKRALGFAHRIELTRVHREVDGDTFFPNLNDDWILEKESLGMVSLF